MIQFMEKADKHARSIDDLEDDMVKNICKAMSRGKRISNDCKLNLDEFWSTYSKTTGKERPAKGGLLSRVSSTIWSKLGRSN